MSAFRDARSWTSPRSGSSDWLIFTEGIHHGQTVAEPWKFKIVVYLVCYVYIPVVLLVYLGNAEVPTATVIPEKLTW